MNPVDVPVVGEFHQHQIEHRDHGNLDSMHGQVLGSERRIWYGLICLGLLPAEYQMNGVSGLGFAVWQKHVQSSGVTKREAVGVCYFLDPLQIRTVNHDVD